MSGVFGLVDTRRRTEISPALQAMAGRMSHRDWYRRETWIDEQAGVGLGRMGIGILNREAQPVTGRDERIVLFLVGEFFDWEGAPARSSQRAPGEADADYALRLYLQHGDEFVHYLHGAFVVAVLDRTRRVLLLANDRYAMYPLYLHHEAGRLIFAPEVKGVLEASNVPRALDDTALAQYLRFQQVLGVRTFFAAVQMLPHASRLTFDLASGACCIEPYWSFAQVPSPVKGIAFEAAVEETARLMRLAVARRLRGEYRLGVYLSGGLDSRTILAAYPEDQPRPTTLTFGLRHCRDVHYAGQLARRAGTQHLYCEFLDGRWVIDCADFHLALTEGFHSWIHMHGISTLEAARERFDINLTGFAGDANLGGFSDVSMELGRLPDEMAYLTRVFHLFNQAYNWPSLSEAEEHIAYTPQTYARLSGLAFESFREELKPYLQYDRDRRMDYFGYTQLEIRHYSHHLTFARSHLDVRHPFCDYDLTDFLFSLPVDIRGNRCLEIAVLNRLSPSLSRVPVDKDELPPMYQGWVRRTHLLAQKVKRRFNRHIYPLFRERFTLHTDYPGWLRTELCAWAESILFDRRTLERGIFNPDFIRSIWARHRAGQEPWTLGKIAPIMSYEMMLRRLYDPPSSNEAFPHTGREEPQRVMKV